MKNKIYKYFEYPEFKKNKYSTRTYEHLKDVKKKLNLCNSKGIELYYYDSGPLNALLEDISLLLRNINLDSKENNFIYFNEIRSSLAIENEYFSIKDIQNKKSYSEQMNKAYTHISNNTEVSINNLLTTFSILTTHIEKESIGFRKEKIYITDGIKYDEKEKAINISKRIQELFKYINDSKINPLLLSILTHYIYEDIHPFFDFNGRTGRLLIHNILLFKTGKTINFISPAINLFRKNYYKSFEDADKGDLTHFITSLLISIHKYAHALNVVNELDLIPSLKDMLINIIALNLKDITYSSYLKKINTKETRQTVYEKLTKLEKRGFLVRKNKTFNLLNLF